MEQLVERLWREKTLTPDEYRQLLAAAETDDALLEAAMRRAREVAVANFGADVYARGLIEVSNYCRNDCYYCGIRRGNRRVERYRLSTEQILECCRVGDGLGFRSFVLQGGEDAGMSDEAITETVAAIRREFPASAITLSLGEKSRETYQRFFDAGADRYLLRHETADPEHYRHLHPASMSFEGRMASLAALRDVGYQVGTGIMVGSPGQTIDTLLKDILFIERFRPEMIGLGPYLPQSDTPFAAEPAGSLRMTLMLLAIFRLMLPRTLIPSTTSLATLIPDGRLQGILAGANVVMPNLSPAEFRNLYALYDNKRSFGTEAAEGVAALAAELSTIGYRLAFVRGDYTG